MKVKVLLVILIISLGVNIHHFLGDAANLLI